MHMSSLGPHRVLITILISHQSVVYRSQLKCSRAADSVHCKMLWLMFARGMSDMKEYIIRTFGVYVCLAAIQKPVDLFQLRYLRRTGMRIQ